MSDAMTSNPVLAQSDSQRRAASGRLPGDGHMWVMVLGDLVIFGGYFIVFMMNWATPVISIWTATVISTIPISRSTATSAR